MTGEAPRGAAFDPDHPEVSFAGEDYLTAMNGGIAIIAAVRLCPTSSQECKEQHCGECGSLVAEYIKQRRPRLSPVSHSLRSSPK